jgi:hypothetical protein
MNLGVQQRGDRHVSIAATADPRVHDLVWHLRRLPVEQARRRRPGQGWPHPDVDGGDDRLADLAGPRRPVGVAGRAEAEGDEDRVHLERHGSQDDDAAASSVMDMPVACPRASRPRSPSAQPDLALRRSPWESL